MIIQLVLLLIVTFAVVIGILHLIFGSQLKIALGSLQVLHQESMEKEEILNKEIERARAQVQSEIERGREEAKIIIDNAKQAAESIVFEASERAQIESKKIISETVEKTKKMENEILESVEEKSAVLAEELIKYTFTAKGQEVLQSHLIDELIEQLKSIDKDKLTVKVDCAQVTTSFALNAAEEEKIKEILFSKLGVKINIEEKIDTSLIIGVMIKLGGLVIDGSLKNKLNKAMNAMRLR